MSIQYPEAMLPKKADQPLDQIMMTVEDVAHFLQLTPETVRSMARRGELTGVRLGRVWRFDRKTLEDDLHRCLNTRGESPDRAADEE